LDILYNNFDIDYLDFLSNLTIERRDWLYSFILPISFTIITCTEEDSNPESKYLFLIVNVASTFS